MEYNNSALKNLKFKCIELINCPVDFVTRRCNAQNIACRILITAMRNCRLHLLHTDFLWKANNFYTNLTLQTIKIPYPLDQELFFRESSCSVLLSKQNGQSGLNYGVNSTVTSAPSKAHLMRHEDRKCFLLSIYQRKQQKIPACMKTQLENRVLLYLL